MKIKCSILAVIMVVGMIMGIHSVGFAQGVEHFAVLNGGNEVSATGQAAAGDPDGFGSATVIVRGTTGICFAILVSGIDPPTAAHIHQANAGVNGPVAITLSAPTSGNPGTASGCVSGLDPVLVKNIRSNSSGFYVNIHNGKFPGGAIRGQLF